MGFDGLKERLRGESVVLIPNKLILYFCLRPSTKEQGITQVVVVLVVLFHLSHFFIKRALREKILPSCDTNLGPLLHQSSTLPTELYDNITQMFENYLLKDFKNNAADLAPVLALVFEVFS